MVKIDSNSFFTPEFSISDILELKELNKSILLVQKFFGIRISIHNSNKYKSIIKEYNQPICKNFHFKNKTSKLACIDSQKALLSTTQKNKLIINKCQNGLEEAVYPVYYSNKHIATILTGQFLTSEPNIEYFKNQAKKYNFNLNNYLAAINNIPILNKSNIELLKELIVNITNHITQYIEGKQNNIKTNNLLEQLKKSEERYRNIFENLVDIVILINNKGIIVDANKNVFKLGYKQNEVIGKNIKDFLPKNNLTKIYDALAQVFSGRKDVDINTEILTKNKSKFYASVNGTLIEHKGEIVDMAIIRDITNFHLDKLKIIENEKKYRLIFEKIPIGIFVTDSNGKIIDANNPFINILGLNSISETININVLTINRAFKIGYSEVFNKCIAEGEQQVFFGKYKSKNKNLIYFECILFPLKDEEGKVLFIYNIVRDITNEKKHENQIIREKKKAQESDKLKTAFLSNMSHEIRTPLNVIVGFSQIIQRNKNLENDKINRYLSHINTSSIQLLELINDILDISKIQSNQLNINIEKVNVNMLIDELYFKYKFKDLNNNVKILEPIKSAKKIYINSDKLKINQVLVNLLNNSAKFTEKGEISFGYYEKEKCIEFFVKDTGCGIEKAYLKKIFNRFEQTKAGANSVYKGNGLGLSISKGIVKKLGGKINVESKENIGSRFYFTLPKNTIYDK